MSEKKRSSHLHGWLPWVRFLIHAQRIFSCEEVTSNTEKESSSFSHDKTKEFALLYLRSDQHISCKRVSIFYRILVVLIFQKRTQVCSVSVCLQIFFVSKRGCFWHKSCQDLFSFFSPFLHENERRERLHYRMPFISTLDAHFEIAIIAAQKQVLLFSASVSDASTCLQIEKACSVTGVQEYTFAGHVECKCVSLLVSLEFMLSFSDKSINFAKASPFLENCMRESSRRAGSKSEEEFTACKVKDWDWIEGKIVFEKRLKTRIRHSLEQRKEHNFCCVKARLSHLLISRRRDEDQERDAVKLRKKMRIYLLTFKSLPLSLSLSLSFREDFNCRRLLSTRRGLCLLSIPENLCSFWE